eukprot:TRINITY_DN308_c0_g1_i1.p1 TRINITY_DN308_c0_g1~~TRINITY_DN308_c0_g1_i1.p1  ORF type:complete len:423 (-),score=116.82 TRINITY_DN308_c0_g1_i1:1012-2280(-)
MDASAVSGPAASEVAATSDSFLANVPLAPPDPILGVTLAYNAETSAKKVNVGVGAYRNEEGKPWVLPVVRKVEQKLAADASLNKEYLPIEGLKAFLDVTGKLLYGADSIALKENRVAVCQSLSGTGALRLGADFIARFFPAGTPVYLPVPTWGNHNKILADAHVPAKTYRYYKPETRGLDFEGLIADLKTAPAGAVILLHVCAHNPTGVDPTREQWAAIADVMQAGRLFPFFDCAYQGFATGDIQGDAYAIRLFVQRGFELCAAQSYSKNFGLYSERIGALSFVARNATQAAAVLSQIKSIARPMYSNPPVHGALLVSSVLNDPALAAEWEANVKVMSGRIQKMRQALYDALQANKTPGDWTHILKQIGMFTFTGLTPPQVQRMIKTHFIFMTGDGRISMAGLNSGNIGYMAEAIKDCVANA